MTKKKKTQIMKNIIFTEMPKEKEKNVNEKKKSLKMTTQYTKMAT